MLVGGFLSLFTSFSLSADKDLEFPWELNPLYAFGSVLNIVLIFLGMVLLLLGAVSIYREELPSFVKKILDKIGDKLNIYPSQVIFLLLSLFCLSITITAILAAGYGKMMPKMPIEVGSWILGIIFGVLGVWDKDEELPKISKKTLIWAFIFFLISAILRGLEAGNIPPVLNGDEGSAGLSAVEFVQGKANNIFGVGWFSFPALFYYIQSLSIRIFQQTTLALRIPSAIGGGLTVSAVFLIGRRMFNPKTGWFAAIFLTGFHFHMHFSRVGLQNIWDGLWYILVLGFLWDGWQNKRRSSFIIAGLGLGLGQYFYVSVRFLPVIIFGWMILAILFDEENPKGFKGNIRISFLLSTITLILVALFYLFRQNDFKESVVRNLPFFIVLGLILSFLVIKKEWFSGKPANLWSMAMVTFVVMLPLAWYYSQHHGQFFAPYNRVSVIGEWMDKKIASENLPVSEIMFNQFFSAAKMYVNDPITMWYNPGTPILRTSAAVFFLVGLILLLIKFRDSRTHLLLLWLATFVATGGMSVPATASQRYIAVAPACALIVGFGISEITNLFSKVWQNLAKGLTIVGFLIVLLLSLDDLRFYFFDYTPDAVMGGPNTWVAQRLAEYLQTKEEGVEVAFFIGNMGYYTHSTLPYLAPHIRGYDVQEKWGSPNNPVLQGDHFIFVITPDLEHYLPDLQEIYPNGDLGIEYDLNGEVLYWYIEISP